eukprot:3315842-Pyramimonas_sp.AAC.1
MRERVSPTILAGLFVLKVKVLDAIALIGGGCFFWTRRIFFRTGRFAPSDMFFENHFGNVYEGVHPFECEEEDASSSSCSSSSSSSDEDKPKS